VYDYKTAKHKNNFEFFVMQNTEDCIILPDTLVLNMPVYKLMTDSKLDNDCVTKTILKYN